MNIFKRFAVTYVTIAVIEKMLNDSRFIVKNFRKFMDKAMPEWRVEFFGEDYAKAMDRMTNKIGF